VIVVDTNVLAYYWLPGQFNRLAESLFLADRDWITSPFWRYEFRNVVLGYLRRGLIDIPLAIRILEAAELKMTGCEFTVPAHALIRVAQSSKCTAYDCEFVALAVEKRVPLVTTDGAILKAFPKVAVSIDEYVASVAKGSH
jgi:predicted nucleic acid-binding protein